MALRDELQKRVDRKQAEIREHEEKIREANAYIQGLLEALKLAPKTEEGESQDASFRHGSSVAKAHEVLKAAGKPLHIIELLKAMGQSVDKKHRLALSGSIAAYVRKGQIFNRPLPNTFGLLEFKKEENPNENRAFSHATVSER